MYQTSGSKTPQVFVSLNRSYDVNKCVRRLTGKTLQGNKVEVKKVFELISLSLYMHLTLTCVSVLNNIDASYNIFVMPFLHVI